MTEDNEYFKKKYESLKHSIQSYADQLEFEKAPQERFCEESELLFVNFDFEVSQCEDHARKKWGNKYDVYKFSHTADK